MSGINAWEDDPQSTATAEPVERPVPELDCSGLGLSIVGRQPSARVYPMGTPGFRYWNAADSLARAVACWRRVVPAGARWHIGRPLVVDLDAGDDLNAYYDRQELCFFHATVRGVTVYSGESPDVLCHELGHALLDAIRPQLWNTASIEVASFHEAFADISAMLSALDLLSVRDEVLASTGGRLSRASRVSRLAEQLGWAIRQLHPDAVDPDCLRNAVNSFFYRQPESLPPMAPASVLSSEPHSFSRVFTAAWLESLAGMAEARGTGEDALAAAACDAGKLLAGAVGTARIASNYFAQIASGLLDADERLTRGVYRSRDPPGLCGPRHPVDVVRGGHRGGPAASCRAEDGPSRGPPSHDRGANRRAHLRPQAPEAARRSAARRHPLVRHVGSPRPRTAGCRDARAREPRVCRGPAAAGARGHGRAGTARG